MADQNNEKHFRLFDTTINRFLTLVKKVSLPGFEKVPIYDVILFFLKGFQKGALVTRASAIAFNLIIAILPSTIFLFTLIPFLPIPNFQTEVLLLFENILPENVYALVEATLIDVITQRSHGLLFFMFLATMIFSTNGVHALINAFNVSLHTFDTHSWLAQRVVSLIFVFILVSLLGTAAILILFSKIAINYLAELQLFERNITYILIILGKWIIVLALLFFAISFLYYLSPAKRTKWKFFSAGSTLATILFVVSSLGFSAFVNNFGQFNKLYGSLGTLIVILLWLYFNSISLLIGFELNVSIKTANLEKEKLSLGKVITKN